MEIYIVYKEDGYGGSEVDKAFKDLSKAINFVIDNKLNHLTFSSEDDLIDEALTFIDTILLE